MKTIVYYYTGTGNSLWVARQLAERVGDASLQAIVDLPAGPVRAQADAIGVVFPVHMWGLPRRIVDWTDRLQIDPQQYYFAAAVNAGQVSRTLIQLRDRLAKRGAVLAAGADCILPSNYVPWGGPPPESEQQRLFAKARTRITRLAETVRARRRESVDRGPLWQRIFFTAIYRLSYPQIPRMDKRFWSDERCNACGICARVCPAGNIALAGGRPVWRHHCEQCLACIQWCPQQAIQFGKKTTAYERYHHPEIRLADVLPGRARSGDV